jgi:hypothetical protein
MYAGNAGTISSRVPASIPGRPLSGCSAQSLNGVIDGPADPVGGTKGALALDVI